MRNRPRVPEFVDPHARSATRCPQEDFSRWRWGSENQHHGSIPHQRQQADNTADGNMRADTRLIDDNERAVEYIQLPPLDIQNRQAVLDRDGLEGWKCRIRNAHRPTLWNRRRRMPWFETITIAPSMESGSTSKESTASLTSPGPAGKARK